MSLFFLTNFGLLEATQKYTLRLKTKNHLASRICDPVRLRKSNPREEEPYGDLRITGDLRNSSNRGYGGTTPARQIRRFDNSASPSAPCPLPDLESTNPKSNATVSPLPRGTDNTRVPDCAGYSHSCSVQIPHFVRNFGNTLDVMAKS